MAQAINTQTQDIITQTKAMTGQGNLDNLPREYQHIGFMASRLGDFTMMNSPIFYGYIVEDDPQVLIDETYKILYGMGFTTSYKDDLATYQPKDVAQTWYIEWRQNRPLRYNRWNGRFSWRLFLIGVSVKWCGNPKR